VVSPQVLTKLTFAAGSSGVRYLGRGWSQPESWGVWSTGGEARLFLPVRSSSQDLRLRMVLSVFSPEPDGQVISVLANDVSLARWEFPARTKQSTKIASVPAELLEDQLLMLRLLVASPASPASFGLSRDTRNLGVGLCSIEQLPGAESS